MAFEVIFLHAYDSEPFLSRHLERNVIYISIIIYVIEIYDPGWHVSARVVRAYGTVISASYDTNATVEQWRDNTKLIIDLI